MGNAHIVLGFVCSTNELKDYSNKTVEQNSVQKQPPEVFFEKGILQNFLFFSKVETDSGTGVPVSFTKLLTTPCSQNTSGQLLLFVQRL